MNKTGLKISLDDSEWQRVKVKIQRDAGDWRPAARNIHQEMIVRVNELFRRNRRGGSYRGATWAYFADQYTRKTDGVVVPAWGGVDRLDGKGKVKGRLRPSGQRVRFGDSVGQDTSNLRRQALTSERLTKSALIMGTNPNYSETFHKRRPFAFFNLPGDLSMMRRHIIDHFER